MLAREFVQVGQATAPTCDNLDAGVGLDGGSDAGVRLVPDVETRIPEGPLGVEVRYWPDSGCSTGPITTIVPVVSSFEQD